MRDLIGDWSLGNWRPHLEDELRSKAMSKQYGVYGLDEQESNISDAEVAAYYEELDISDADVAQVWGELQAVPSYTERFVALPVLMEDEPLHTMDNPYCPDESCPCHTDEALFAEYVEQPMDDGLLTSWEASRLQWGETF
jgi:hypothetical protein